MARWRLWSVLAALLLAALGLAACGKDEEAPPPTETPTIPLVNHDTLTRYRLGDQAPAFTLPDLAGRQVSLADYQGRQPVLLFFHMAVG